MRFYLKNVFSKWQAPGTGRHEGGPDIAIFCVLYALTIIHEQEGNSCYHYHIVVDLETLKPEHELSYDLRAAIPML